jgi:hypothetical protein
MPTCLTHNQSYPQDGWCVYCGQPVMQTIVTSVPPSSPYIYFPPSVQVVPPCVHDFGPETTAGRTCRKCGTLSPPPAPNTVIYQQVSGNDYHDQLGNPVQIHQNA